MANKYARTQFDTIDLIDWNEGKTGQDIGHEAAQSWLDNNYKYIEEAMVRAGWDAIDTLNSLDPMLEYVT